MKSWSFDTYPNQNSRHLAEAREWIDKGVLRYDVVIYGPHGTGKTSLAIAMLRALLELREHAGLFVGMRDILLQIRSGYADKSSELWTLRRYASAPILVIDEVGQTKGDSEHGEQTLSYLLDTRQGADRRTILTTNLDIKEEMPAFVGGRTWDRLREQAAFWHIGGQSKRQTHKRT